MNEILMIALKATIVIVLTFALGWALRVRASVKHVLFSALFAFLLLLPFASRYMRNSATEFKVSAKTVVGAAALSGTATAEAAVATKQHIHWRVIALRSYVTVAALLLAS